MKKLAFAFIIMLALVILASCDDTETYAEQRDRENSAISQFIRDSSITVITESGKTVIRRMFPITNMC